MFPAHRGTPGAELELKDNDNSAELLQAKVKNVYYLGDFAVADELDDQLQALIARFRTDKGRVKKLVVPGIDPHLGSSGSGIASDTGHSMPAA